MCEPSDQASQADGAPGLGVDGIPRELNPFIYLPKSHSTNPWHATPRKLTELLILVP